MSRESRKDMGMKETSFSFQEAAEKLFSFLFYKSIERVMQLDGVDGGDTRPDKVTHAIQSN